MCGGQEFPPRRHDGTKQSLRFVPSCLRGGNPALNSSARGRTKCQTEAIIIRSETNEAIIIRSETNEDYQFGFFFPSASSYFELERRRTGLLASTPACHMRRPALAEFRLPATDTVTVLSPERRYWLLFCELALGSGFFADPLTGLYWFGWPFVTCALPLTGLYWFGWPFVVCALPLTGLY